MGSGCSFLLGIDGVLGADESVMFSVPATLFEAVVAIVKKAGVHKLKNKLILQNHYRGQEAALNHSGGIHSILFW